MATKIEFTDIETELPAQGDWVMVKTDYCRYPIAVCQYLGSRFVNITGSECMNIYWWSKIIV